MTAKILQFRPRAASQPAVTSSQSPIIPAAVAAEIAGAIVDAMRKAEVAAPAPVQTSEEFEPKFRAERLARIVKAEGIQVEGLRCGGMIARACWPSRKTGRNAYLLACWQGAAMKPSIYGTYGTEAAREETAAYFKANRASAAEARESRRAAKKNAPNPLKVGAILYTSWGYDQTNVEFYRVASVRGKAVDLVELESQTVSETGPFSSSVLPTETTKGAEIRGKFPSPDGAVRISDCRTAWVWDGRPKHCSWGH